MTNENQAELEVMVPQDWELWHQQMDLIEDQMRNLSDRISVDLEQRRDAPRNFSAPTRYGAALDQLLRDDILAQRRWDKLAGEYLAHRPQQPQIEEEPK